MEREEAHSHSPAQEDQCLLSSPDPTGSGHPTDIIRANQREEGKQLGNDFFFLFFLAIGKLRNMSTLTSFYSSLPSILVATLIRVYIWLFTFLKVICCIIVAWGLE